MSLKTSIIGDITEINSNVLPLIIYGRKDDKSEPIIAVLRNNNTVVDTSNHNYEIINDAYSYNICLIFNLCSSRNIITATVFRSLLRTIYDKKYGIADDMRNDEINFILNTIRTPSIGIRVQEDITDYIYTFYASYMNQILNTYRAKIVPISLTGIRIKPKYPIIYIPKDLQNKINNMHAYFNELKDSMHD